MATLTCLRFLKLIFASVAFVALRAATRMPKVIEVNKGINRGSSTLGLGYASFKKEPFYHLNITCLGADLLHSESECGFACLETPSCFSYNVAAFPDINGKLLCELLPSDMYNNTEKLIPNKGHHHFSIASLCSSWPCKNKGECVSLYEENSYICVCEDGFTGKNCETDVNECQSNPCLNNGTCVDLINGFNCSCPPGFVGNRCQTDVDECTASSPVCDVNAICNNTLGSYLCTCKLGFYGDGKTCTDIDECNASHSVCGINATCHNNQGSYVCSCNAGFIGDGKNCTAVRNCNCWRSQSQSPSRSWGYHGVDAIDFQTDGDVILQGYRLWGVTSGSTSFQVTIGLYCDSALIAEKSGSYPTISSVKTFEVYFSRVISIRAGVTYTATANVTTSYRCHAHTDGIANASCSGATVTFKHSSNDTNASSVFVGQIPALIFLSSKC